VLRVNNRFWVRVGTLWSQACIVNFEEVGSCCEKLLFYAAYLMNNIESLTTMPVSLSSPPCPEAATDRRRKENNFLVNFELQKNKTQFHRVKILWFYLCYCLVVTMCDTRKSIPNIAGK